MTKPKKAAQRPRGAKPKASAAGTKLQRLETMLRRPEGATIAQLSKALDWQAHSIRGAMSGALERSRALPSLPARPTTRNRIYRIEG